MSKSKPITAKEREAIKRSVKVAREKFVQIYDPCAPIKTPQSVVKFVIKLAIGNKLSRKKDKLEDFLMAHWDEAKDGLQPRMRTPGPNGCLNGIGIHRISFGAWCPKRSRSLCPSCVNSRPGCTRVMAVAT
jgi:hypothetical protein